MDFFQMFIGGYILSLIGGTLRFVFGSLKRKILNQPKFTYSEYINGPKKSNHYDDFGHAFVNKVIGFCFLAFIVVMLANL
ncbi:MAG: hypothetical protein ABNG98_00880 [Flavobacterium sp.]|jgi:Trk-type K+ transport system membrane component